MENQGNGTPSGFKGFAFKRFIIAVIIILLIVWALSVGPGMMLSLDRHKPDSIKQQEPPMPGAQEAPTAVASLPAAASPTTDVATSHPGREHASDHGGAAQPPEPKPKEAVQTPLQHPPETAEADETHQPPPSEPSEPSAAAAVEPVAPPEDEKGADESPPAMHHEASETQPQPHEAPHAPDHAERPVGVTFVEAVIQPLEYELNHRFWGWRPNDIVNFTDNINHYQRGALEVTRRSVVLLSERIARTGTTDAFNPHLENAMNWLMIKADRYWFPAPESKYKESIKELKKYKEGLTSGQASFYTRTDNIIPLLSSYEDLLGSCDENLVKQKDEDGDRVSFFSADDYYFYAKGVASTMAVILEAVHHDFAAILKSRHAEELLHHAIMSCRQAAELDPLLITNSDLDGIFANHRANLAAPVSHARFYIGLLIKTLST